MKTVCLLFSLLFFQYFYAQSNNPPVYVGWEETRYYEYLITASDADNDSITFFIKQSYNWSTIKQKSKISAVIIAQNCYDIFTIPLIIGMTDGIDTVYKTLDIIHKELYYPKMVVSYPKNNLVFVDSTFTSELKIEYYSGRFCSDASVEFSTAWVTLDERDNVNCLYRIHGNPRKQDKNVIIINSTITWIPEYGSFDQCFVLRVIEPSDMPVLISHPKPIVVGEKYVYNPAISNSPYTKVFSVTSPFDTARLSDLYSPRYVKTSFAMLNDTVYKYYPVSVFNPTPLLAQGIAGKMYSDTIRCGHLLHKVAIELIDKPNWLTTKTLNDSAIVLQGIVPDLATTSDTTKLRCRFVAGGDTVFKSYSLITYQQKNNPPVYQRWEETSDDKFILYATDADGDSISFFIKQSNELTRITQKNRTSAILLATTCTDVISTPLIIGLTDGIDTVYENPNVFHQILSYPKMYAKYPSNNLIFADSALSINVPFENRSGFSCFESFIHVKPYWMTFKIDSAQCSFEIYGTPTKAHKGVNQMKSFVTWLGTYEGFQQCIAFRVLEPTDVPVLTTRPKPVLVGEKYLFTPTISKSLYSPVLKVTYPFDTARMLDLYSPRYVKTSFAMLNDTVYRYYPVSVFNPTQNLKSAYRGRQYSDTIRCGHLSHQVVISAINNPVWLKTKVLNDSAIVIQGQPPVENNTIDSVKLSFNFIAQNDTVNKEYYLKLKPFFPLEVIKKTDKIMVSQQGNFNDSLFCKNVVGTVTMHVINQPDWLQFNQLQEDSVFVIKGTVPIPPKVLDTIHSVTCIFSNEYDTITKTYSFAYNTPVGILAENQSLVWYNATSQLLELSNADFSIDIYNSLGQLLVRYSHSKHIDLTDLPKGIFVANITSRQYSLAFKFLR